jgi:hypothetical protein
LCTQTTRLINNEKGNIALRLFPSFEPEGGELKEPADVAAGVEPLEEAPEEADPEILEERTELLSGIGEIKF